MALYRDCPLPESSHLRWYWVGLLGLSVLGTWLVFVETDTRDYRLTWFGIVEMLVGGFVVLRPLHEVMHYVLFRLGGARATSARNWAAVNAPDARLPSIWYLVVLLAPLALILGLGVALLKTRDAWPLGVALAAGGAPVFASDLSCAAVVATERGPGVRWADLPGAVRRYG